MPYRRILINAVLALLLIGLSACDFLGEEETLEFRKEVKFRFEFSTAGRVGQALNVASTTTTNLDDLLFGEGYTREDVGTANIRSVEVERIQPVGTTLDVFDRIDLTLTASGVNVPTLATSDNLPSAKTATLDLLVPGVTEAVIAPQFGARLTVVPTVAEDFDLEAVIELKIQVKGI